METQCPITRIKNLFKGNSFTLLRDFQKNPYAFFEKHKPKDSKKIVRLKLGYRSFFFSYDPTHAQHILQDRRHRYDKSSLVLKKIKHLSGPEGLIQLKGEEALRVRKSSAQLMSQSGMDRLVKKVAVFTEELFPLIDRAIELHEAFDMLPHLTRIVLRTAGVFVLNHDLISESDELNKAFVTLNRLAGESLRSLVGCPFSLQKNRSLNVIHKELDRISDEVLHQEAPSLFRNLKMAGESNSFIRDQIKAFMFAGYDTTASSLIFATYLVAANSSTQTRIAHEARQTKELNTTLNYEQLRQSAFVQATYQESLRLYPSAYFLPRESNEEDEINGTKIPKGSQVFLSVRHIQRHPEYFENPNAFKPERFLTELKHPFSFLPFGGGPRVCIGAMLAKLEATLVLQKLCERYEFSPFKSEAPAIEGLITAHTKDPLPLVFKKRPSKEAI